jgi:hypothetical protein
MLEAHDCSPVVAFAHLRPGYTLMSLRTKTVIETELARLDFADFAHLRGDREVVAAFDLGFGVLHELVHGVLRLDDTGGDCRQVGNCDEPPRPRKRVERLYCIKPRSVRANLPMFGSTAGKSLWPTPNQRASVAEYSSTAIVGIHRPSPESSGPSICKTGTRP